MDIVRLGGALGAEVRDVAPDGVLDDAEVADLAKALLDHKVLVLKVPEMTPEGHMALGRQLGEIEIHAFFPNLGPGHEQVSVLDSDEGTTASMWHSDETFLPHPPMGTMTHAKILPAVGGDTLFASTAAAYQALSANMKRYLDGVMAVHDLANIAAMRHRFGAPAAQFAEAIAAERCVRHPVVRIHPETGEQGLFVNPTYTRFLDGLPPDEADLVLGHLFRHSVKEPFTYRHRWEVGDLLIWDNRAVLHLVLNDFEGRRLMYRVSVVGTAEG